MPYSLNFLVEDDRDALMYRIHEGCQPTPNNWSKLDDSNEIREQLGNQLFRDGQYEPAFETYARAFKMIPYAKRCKMNKSDDNQVVHQAVSYFQKCHESAAKCLSNAAACILKDVAAKEKYYNFYNMACQLCNLAMEIDPSNLKPKYRYGLAMFMGENFRGALLVFGDLQDSKVGTTEENNGNQIASYIGICQSKIRLIQSAQSARCEKILENHDKILTMLQFRKFQDAYRLQCKNLFDATHLLLTKFELGESIENQLTTLVEFYQTEAMVLMFKTLSKDDFETIFDKECDDFMSRNFHRLEFLMMTLLAYQFLKLGLYRMADSIYKKIEPFSDKQGMVPAYFLPNLKYVGSYASAMAQKEAVDDMQTNNSTGKGKNKSRNRR